ARIEQPDGIELLLDRTKRLVERVAELPPDPLAAAQAVAVLAAVGAAIFAHELGCFLGDRAHLRRAAFRPATPHVEDGTHVQRPDRSVRIPGAARAVAREYVGERRGV